ALSVRVSAIIVNAVPRRVSREAFDRLAAINPAIPRFWITESRERLTGLDAITDFMHEVLDAAPSAELVMRPKQSSRPAVDIALDPAALVRTLVIVGGKGGVGKSTVATALAIAATDAGPAGAPPGIDELYALSVVGESVPRFSSVIVDPAPTGHLLRLIEMPAIALDWTHRLMRLLLKYKDIAGLGETAQDLLDFAKRTRALTAL